MRGGRVVERIELVHASPRPGRMPIRDTARPVSEAEVLQAALQQFYASESRAAGDPPAACVAAAETRGDRGLAVGAAGRRVRIVVPKRGDKRGLLELAARNAQVAYQTRFNENVAAHYDALETLRSVLAPAGHAAPHRVLRHLDHPGQRDGGLDGRVRRRADEAGGVPEVPDPRLAGSRLAMPDAGSDTGHRESRGARSHGTRILDDFASMREVVLRRYRKVLENGGPFPDLILIDGGKGQLSAAYAALEELGLANLVAVGIAKKEELLFTRDQDEPIALPDGQPGAAADPADPRRGAPVRRDVPPQSRTKRDCDRSSDVIAGIGPRRRSAADGVRQPGRRPPRDPRGADAHRRRQGCRRRARALRARGRSRRRPRMQLLETQRSSV